jgi:Uma2 family endonuclease
MALRYDPNQYLPSAAELPDSDDTPVDHEFQNLMPDRLRAALAMVWSERTDWFLGVRMGIYFDPNEPAIVPDGFLSLGVERFVGGEDGRLSYVLWEENGIPPILALEVVSKPCGIEYERKQARCAELGVLYYVIYSHNWRSRGSRQPLEVYRLVEGQYEILAGNPVWFPEIGLGLGRERGLYRGLEREWLYWYDESGNRLLTPDEEAALMIAKAQQAELKAQQEKAESKQAELKIQKAENQSQKLAAKLKELGIDPNTV